MAVTEISSVVISYIGVEKVERRFHVGLLEAQKFQILNKLNLGESSTFNTDHVMISAKKGLKFRLINEKKILEVGFIPHDWEQYCACIFVQDLVGLEAIQEYENYYEWHVEVEVIQMLGKIERGELSIDDVTRVHPNPSHLFNHRLMKNCLVHHYLSGQLRGKRGKRVSLDRAVIELYGWANYYYADNPNLSEEAARAKALDNHPDKVPQWKDPDSAFKQRWEGFDEQAEFSQKSFRVRVRKVFDNK